MRFLKRHTCIRMPATTASPPANDPQPRVEVTEQRLYDWMEKPWITEIVPKKKTDSVNEEDQTES